MKNFMKVKGLYGAPTSEQVDSFWTEVCLAFEELMVVL